jgi:hypothetical protein
MMKHGNETENPVRTIQVSFEATNAKYIGMKVRPHNS